MRPAAHRLGQHRLGRLLAEQIGLARGAGAVMARPPMRAAATANRLVTRCQYRLGHRLRIAPPRRSPRSAPDRLRRPPGNPAADAGEEIRAQAARSDRRRCPALASRASDSPRRHPAPASDPGAGPAARSAPRSPPGPRPGPSPDRPWWNRRSGRTPPTSPPPAPGGWCARHVRPGRRNAAASPPAADQARSPFSSSSRSRSAPGAPPGSRVRSTGSPARASASASRPAWVDLPAPSPPSSVMKRPGCTPSLPTTFAQLRVTMCISTAMARPGRPSRGTSAPASSGSSCPARPRRSRSAAERGAARDRRRDRAVVDDADLAPCSASRAACVTTRSRPPTSGTVGAVPSQTGACSTTSPAVNSVTSSNSRNAHSSSFSLSSARGAWCPAR